LVVHLVRQDLSIAGKRKGLAGERSGLFMEQIRIIKEMREHDRKTGRTGEFVRPRYMVWENVVGAQSSQKGRDFAAVLEEAIRVAEPEAPDIQVPDKGWPTWGGYRDVDGRWSVAWRVLDAQWGGVPQRRRRIALVADFGGTTAHEILFNTKGVYGHPAAGGEAGEGSSRGTESGTHESGAWAGCLTPYDTQTNRVYGADGIWPTLPARENIGQNRQSVFCVPINDKATRFSGGGDTRKDDGAGNGLGVGHDGEPSPTLTAADRHGVYCAGFKLGNGENARSIGYAEELSPTLNAECGGNKPAILDMSHANDVIRECGEVVPTLQSRMGTGGNQVPLTYQKVAGTLSPGAHAGSYNGQDAYNDMLICSAERPDTHESAPTGIVRRLTPLECERLQNFPDGWTDIGAWTDEKGKLHKESSDSARYKALGNSIALPPWKWVLKRLCAQYERDATMGSLFDGIGGFPLIWMQLNGWNSVKWASEIEPFCIAVTKRHFGDENGDGDAWRHLMEVKK
jgi:DNA (cytosine-5)-methyltransferase 1